MTQATLRKPLQVNAERLGQARELIAAGTTMREAAAAVALANSTLYYHGLRADPEHLRRRRAETARIGARWDRDRILAAISDWEELYGAPPAVVDWHPAMARRKGHPDRAERYAAGAW